MTLAIYDRATMDSFLAHDQSCISFFLIILMDVMTIKEFCQNRFYWISTFPSYIKLTSCMQKTMIVCLNKNDILS